MTIELPDKELHNLRLTTEQARVELAVGVYTGQRVSLGRAAKVARMPKVLFMQELARRGIGMHYSMEDLEHDIQMVEQLSRKRKAA